MTPPEIFSAELIKTVCDQSLPPRGEYGQNFLIDWDVPAKEASYADLTADDTVLEIGPGLGTLTCVLADRADRVVAIEKDDRFGPMLARLSNRYGNVDVLYSDVLEYDLGSVRFDKVVANLPYGVSLPIIFELLNAGFETAVLLIQDELADRITKSPGESGYNRLSVQLFRRCNVHRLQEVPTDAFYPAPEVAGRIVRITNVQPKFEVPSEEFFKKTLMFFFSQRESTVRAALSDLAESDGPIDLSAEDLVTGEDDIEDVLDTPVPEVKSGDFGGLTRALYGRFGDDAETAIDAFFEERGLYKRTRE